MFKSVKACIGRKMVIKALLKNLSSEMPDAIIDVQIFRWILLDFPYLQAILIIAGKAPLRNLYHEELEKLDNDIRSIFSEEFSKEVDVRDTVHSLIEKEKRRREWDKNFNCGGDPYFYEKFLSDVIPIKIPNKEFKQKFEQFKTSFPLIAKSKIV